MRRRLVLGFAVLAALPFGSTARPSLAEGGFDPVAMAHALEQVSVSLEQGLKASEGQGQPISAKFEIENGALQLSVYTAKGDKFSEVIVDHKSGAIGKNETITGGDDLKEAKMQGAAMANARLSLEAAVSNAVKANAGHRAVSVEPALEGGQPVAKIMLMKGQSVKTVTEKLN
jgi:hypothetical protein